MLLTCYLYTHVVVSLLKFAHPVCSRLALILFGFVCSEDRRATSHLAQASEPRLKCRWDFNRSAEFCKVMPSSEQDEKWAMLSNCPLFSELLSEREIYVVWLRYEAKVFSDHRNSHWCATTDLSSSYICLNRKHIYISFLPPTYIILHFSIFSLSLISPVFSFPAD